MSVLSQARRGLEQAESLTTYLLHTSTVTEGPHVMMERSTFILHAADVTRHVVVEDEAEELCLMIRTTEQLAEILVGFKRFVVGFR